MKLLTKLTIVFSLLLGCANAQDFCGYNQETVDSLNTLVNSYKYLYEENGLNIYETLAPCDRVIFRNVTYRSDTFMLITPEDMNEYFLYLQSPPVSYIFRTDSTYVAFRYSNESVRLSVRKYDSLLLYLKGVEF